MSEKDTTPETSATFPALGVPYQVMLSGQAAEKLLAGSEKEAAPGSVIEDVPATAGADACPGCGGQLVEREEFSTDQAVERLKAAIKEEEAEEYESGKDWGRFWAKEFASPKELRRIAKYVQEDRGCDPAWWDLGDQRYLGGPSAVTDAFAFQACPAAKGDRQGAADFWDYVLGEWADRISDADFFHGFGDGVAEVWDQVKDKLK